MRAFRPSFGRGRPLSPFLPGTPPGYDGDGSVSFFASPGHASVLYYEIRTRAEGGTTILNTLNVGVPTPNSDGLIRVDATIWFAGIPAGNYTLSVAAVSASGTSESTISNAFTLPV